MTRGPLTDEMMELVAQRFKALAEPARLRLLNALRDGEKTVSELMAATGMGQANVSKHLNLLHAQGYTTRRKNGLFVHYSLSDPQVFALCDIMCGRIESEARTRHGIFEGRGK
jgi:DNA-binding transcriptional ArsR family regulator